LPYLGTIRIDRSVLAFAASLGIFTGIMFGFVPALTMSTSDHAIVMKDGTPRAGLSPRRRLIASALTVAEIALGLVLLIGAALLLESFSRITRVDVGFDPNHVTTFTVSLPRTFDTPSKRITAYDQIRDQLALRPAVQHVAYINGLPLSQGDVLFRVEGRTSAQDAKGDARVRFASPDYFAAMGIPLVRGRVLTAQDAEASEPVIVVNRSLAEHFWPNGDVLGSFVWIGQPMGPAQAERAPRRIVGIVGDIRGYSVAGGLSDDMYEPAAQSLGGGAVSFAIRSNEDLRTLAPHVRDVVGAMLPDQPVTAIRTMEDVIATSASVKDQRFHAVLLGIFGALGLLIVMVGVYGVVSYAVAQHTPNSACAWPWAPRQVESERWCYATAWPSPSRVPRWG
jgi:putative ABC transport system permease protein